MAWAIFSIKLVLFLVKLSDKVQTGDESDFKAYYRQIITLQQFSSFKDKTF